MTIKTDGITNKTFTLPTELPEIERSATAHKTEALVRELSPFDIRDLPHSPFEEHHAKALAVPDDLWPALQRHELYQTLLKYNQDDLLESDVAEMISYAKNNPVLEPTVVKGEESGLKRTLLLTPDGCDIFLKGEGVKLGKGSYKNVKLTLNIEKNKKHALAVISTEHLDELTTQQIHEEIKRMQELKGTPGIVEFVAFAKQGNKLYILMEECDGGELFDALNRHLPFRAKLQAALDSAGGLEQLHNRKLLHRDIKSENILLFKNGRAKLGDLGFVCEETDRLAREVWCGTPVFFAPEKILAKADAQYIKKDEYGAMRACDTTTKAADIWALGVSLFELFAGVPLEHTDIEDQELFVKTILHLSPFDIEVQIHDAFSSNFYWRDLSSLFKGMLSIRPQGRPTIGQVIKALKAITNDYDLRVGRKQLIASGLKKPQIYSN